MNELFSLAALASQVPFVHVVIPLFKSGLVGHPAL